jgi:hypothetical protein
MPEENQDQKSPEVRDPDKLLQHYDQAKEEVRSLKGQLKAFGDLKPEDIKALTEFKTQKEAEAQQAKEEQLKKEQQYEALLAERIGAVEQKSKLELDRLQKQVSILEAERDDWKTKFEGFQTETNTRLLRSSVQDAFLKAGGKVGSGELSADHYFNYLWATSNNRFKLDDSGSVQVLSQDGKAIATDAKGNALSLNDFMESYKAKDDSVFRFEVKGEGSGSLGSGSPGKVAPQRTISEENGILNLRKSGVSLEDIISGKVKVRS